MSIEQLIRDKYASQIEASRVSGMGAAQVGAPASMLNAQASMVRSNADMGALPIQQQRADADLITAQALRSRVPFENDVNASVAERNRAGTRWIGDPRDFNSLRQQPATSANFNAFTETPFTTIKTKPSDDPLNRTGLGYKRGTARVPGKGSGKVDTVDAKLAPGEAVLNKRAAEMVGRGNIAALNARGAQQMGLGMRSNDEMKHYAAGCASVPHYAEGTAYVDPNAASRDAFYRAQMQPQQPPAMPMPRIDHGPAPSTPAGPRWDASQPMRPAAPPPPPAGWATGFQPTAPAPMGGPNAFLQSQGIGVPPPVDMTPPRIPPAPQYGIPNRPAAPPRAWDQDFVDQHRADAMPPAQMMDEPSYIPGPPPVMQPRGLGMLGSERARGGMSAFEKAFAANRKAAGGGGGTFNFKGKTYNTKLAGER